MSAAEVAGIESIQLFVDRARAVRPDFAVTDDNAAAVAEICRRLDGLPLAIELAAARLRLFSPEALRDRLGSRLELLRSAARDVPERQQTLRATIDWSYALLEPAEQRVFEGWRSSPTRTSAPSRPSRPRPDGRGRREAPTDRPVAIDVIESLASLIEKSLVRQVDVGAVASPACGCSRRSASSRPSSSTKRPEAAAVRRAHAAYFADLAAALHRDLSGGDRDRAMAVMTTEVGNFRIALRYWVEQADVGELTKLASSLLILNEARGWYHDTVELATDMLAILTRMDSTPELVGKEIALRLTHARALMATQGFTPEVVEAYTRTLDLFERDQASGQHYSVLRSLANLYALRSEFDKAAEIGERILAMAAAEDDPDMLIDGHFRVGSTLAFTGRLREGLAHFDTAIGLFEAGPDQAIGSRLGNDSRVACYTTSAFTLWTLGLPDQAVERADAAIALSDRLGHPWTSAFARFHSGPAPPVAPRAGARARPGDPAHRDRRRVRLPDLVRDRVVPAGCGAGPDRPGRRRAGRAPHGDDGLPGDGRAAGLLADAPRRRRRVTRRGGPAGRRTAAGGVGDRDDGRARIARADHGRSCSSSRETCTRVRARPMRRSSRGDRGWRRRAGSRPGCPSCAR